MSRLISQEEAQAMAQGPVTLNLCDVEDKARQAVARAKAEAKHILTDAVARAREMERVAAMRGEKAGHDAGFNKGQEAGRVQALEAETGRIQEATSSVREALLEVLTEIEAHRHEVLSDAKQGLLRLAVTIAERICRARIEQRSDHLRPLVEEIIETSGRQGGLLLRVNPADQQAVEAFLGDLHGRLAGDGTAVIRLTTDEGVQRGGCVAERPIGRIDATVETQMARIVAELLGEDVAAPPPTGEKA